MKQPFDVIVLGLGAMGSAAAYQLARSGRRVLGIDQFRPPHTHGSTHGQTRITRLAIGEGLHYTPLALRSHEIWREIEQETDRNLLTITGGLIISSPRSNANLHVPAFFKNTIAAAQHYQIDHEVLDAAAARKRFPQFNLSDDDIAYYEHQSGFLRPEECVSANLQLAARYGAQLHIDEKVLEFSDSGSGVSVRSDTGCYSAGRLVVSAGPWLPQLLQAELACHFRVTRQVLFWFELAQNPQRFAPGNCPVFIWEREGLRQAFYGFPAVSGAADGVKVATEQYLAATTPQTVDRAVSEEEIRTMYTDCIAPCLPDLGPRCLRAVTCLYTSTPDSGFVIAPHPQMNSVLLVSPCSGHGFKHSAAIGELVARLIQEERSKGELAHFSMPDL